MKNHRAVNRAHRVAARTVVAWAMGADASRITLYGNALADFDLSLDDYDYATRDRLAEMHAIVLMVGPLAELKITGRPWSEVRESPAYARCKDMASLLFEERKKIVFWAERVLTHAELYLFSKWPWIESVAEALMEKGALEPHEVDSLVSAYHQPPTMLAVAHFLAEQRRTFRPPRTAKPLARRPMPAPGVAARTKPSRQDRRIKNRRRQMPVPAVELAAAEHSQAL